jgi:hypothetical protein
VMLLFVRVSGVNRNPDATLMGMFEGTASRPYVYRALLPATARLLVSVTPNSLKDRVDMRLQHTDMGCSFLKYFRVPPDFGYEGVVVLALMLAALIGYVLFLSLLARELGFPGNVGRHLAPVLGLLALPPFFVFGYIYDFPVLFFMTCCLYLLVKRKFVAYLVVFTLACLNKETSILLLVAYGAAFFSILPARKYITLGVIQVGLFLSTKGAIEWVFRDNPGTVMIVTAKAQFGTLLGGIDYSQLLLCVLFVLLLGYRWAEKSHFLKQALWMFVPLLILFMLGSCPGEYRVFYEVLPVAVLLVTDTLLRTVFPPSELS